MPLKDLTRNLIPKEVSLDRLAGTIWLRRQALSEDVASKILKLFKLSVGTTVALTVVLALIDTFFIWKGIIEPADRLVTDHVLMAIIGASVVQVGAAVAAIVYGLFPRSPDPDAPAEDLQEPPEGGDPLGRP